jgi:hypothetical protein
MKVKYYEVANCAILRSLEGYTRRERMRKRRTDVLED